MTHTEKEYPNFAKITALLNQEQHPRRMLRALVYLMVMQKGGEQHDTQ